MKLSIPSTVAITAGFALLSFAGCSRTTETTSVPGSNAQIKDFGKKLVADHTKLNTDLKDIAAKLSLSLHMDVSREQRKIIDKFAKLSGAEFDREFWKDSVGDHRDDIDEFRKESDRGENQDLRSFASNSIPTLEEHLRLAENKGMNKLF